MAVHPLPEERVEENKLSTLFYMKKFINLFSIKDVLALTLGLMACLLGAAAIICNQKSLRNMLAMC